MIYAILYSAIFVIYNYYPSPVDISDEYYEMRSKLIFLISTMVNFDDLLCSTTTILIAINILSYLSSQEYLRFVSTVRTEEIGALFMKWHASQFVENVVYRPIFKCMSKVEYWIIL